ncbi:MAG TPA: choice-of-anchor Q domain-containing protein [Solirubrobacterales bacterium]|nr:choice-of-anchor Q domain-containing protein [Solirubrobacterales bacterium]
MGSRAAIATGAGVGATVLFAPAADAAIFTVTNLNNAGAGSLRQAVIDANAAAGTDTVVFQSGLTGTVTLAGTDIDVLESLEIQGPDAGVITVSGNNASRIFYINPDTNGNPGDPVRISGLTLTDGNAGADGGGALYATLTRVTLYDLVITGSEADTHGGAVLARNTSLNVLNSSMSGNRAGGDGGAIYRDENNFGTETINTSTFSNNQAGGDGGGIALYDTLNPTLIENSTISSNTALHGGGITLYDGVPGGRVTLDAVTVSNNRAFDQGGGLDVDELEDSLTIQNSTFSGNSATNEGGGIYSGLDDTVNVTIHNSTIVNSTIVNNAAGTTGGGAYTYSDTPAISSTIVAANAAPTGPDLGESAVPAATGAFNVGFSLIQNPAGATITASPPGSNITGVDAQLGPLTNNGGPTQTHEPLFTSPVIDAGMASGLATDTRGLRRKIEIPSIPNRSGSDDTDIGSVEIQTCRELPAHAFTAGAAGQTLSGSPETDLMIGGAANDTLNGLAGTDCVSGADGDDTANADEGADLVTGDAGNDTATGGAGKDNVNGGAGKDRLKGNGGKDKVKGAAGKDQINGDGGNDKVAGGAGKDRIKGGNAKDGIKGNGGKDKINSIDRTVDNVDCGGGKDTAKVDSIDRVSRSCEVVKEKRR